VVRSLLRPWLVAASLLLAGAPALAEEHAPAEAESGDHAAGHAAGHEVRHLDNWFSFSFGPGKEHQNGPLAFAILNFVLLVWLVVKFGRKPFRDYLQQRHSSVRKDLEDAAALHTQARQQLDEMDGKLRGLDREIAEIKAAVAADAQLEKERIIKAAQAEAERIIAQADDTLSKELNRARHRLELEAVDAAMKAAEKLLKQKVNDADRQRLAEEYFHQLGSGSGSGGGSN
jgi:F-type H+-transporting ATPase subunit b